MLKRKSSGPLTNRIAAVPLASKQHNPRSRMEPSFEHLHALEIRYTDINLLRPSAHNARTHSSRQIKQIQRSIEHFGFTNPVLIDEAGQILAGVCTENSIRIDDVTESPKLAE
jgi:hypothetical protein